MERDNDNDVTIVSGFLYKFVRAWTLNENPT